MSRKNTLCRLFVEQLEGRKVPTATAPDVVWITELLERRQYVLPGATKVVVANLKIGTSSKDFFAQPTQMFFIGASGGGALSEDTSGVGLWADLDGIRKNGCETLWSEGTADPDTGVVGFNTFYAPAWANRSGPLRLQVVANFKWQLNNDRMGVKLVKAYFDDIHGAAIADTSVVYRGYKPTLHILRVPSLHVVQEQMAATATVSAGDRVSLVEFFVGDKQVSSAKMMFPLAKGNLNYATDYTLVHVNWVGERDQFIPGTVVGGKVQFELTEGFARGNWKLEAVMANVSSGSELQLMMPTDGTSLIAWDVHGKKLKGFRWNEIGGGQIQVSGQAGWATVYTVDN